MIGFYGKGDRASEPVPTYVKIGIQLQFLSAISLSAFWMLGNEALAMGTISLALIVSLYVLMSVATRERGISVEKIAGISTAFVGVWLLLALLLPGLVSGHKRMIFIIGILLIAVGGSMFALSAASVLRGRSEEGLKDDED